MFLLHGTIYAHGTPDNKIIFDGGGNSNFFSAKGSDVNAFLDLDYCIIRNGKSFWPPTGFAQYGSFSLKRSELHNIENYSYIWGQGETNEKDVYIGYNRFINAAGFEICGKKVYIRYNLFVRNRGFIVRNDVTPPETVVKYNSFLNMSGIVLELPLGYSSAGMTGTENYWGTTNTEVIASLIYDKHDSINCASFIGYLPILAEPHPDTPKISSSISRSVSSSNLTLGGFITVSGFIEPPVSNANVTLAYTKPDFSILNRTVVSADDGSYRDIVTPESAGLWSVKAIWEGDLVHEGASSSPVSFYVAPYSEVHCIDGDNDNLMNLEVDLYDSTGHLVGTKNTNSTGWIKFMGLQPDNYTLICYWHGVQVASHVVDVKSATTIDPLHCGVFDYYIHVLDGDGEGVGNANVILYFADGTYFTSAWTNSSGWAEFTRLPNTTYTSNVTYLDVRVAEGSINLSFEGQTEVALLSIYDLVVYVVDDKGGDLPNAVVTLSWLNGAKIASKSTNGTGSVVFENLPSATYSIKVALGGYKDESAETALTSEDQTETIILQSIPFVETPTGIFTISGVTVFSIIVIIIILKKRLRA